MALEKLAIERGISLVCPDGELPQGYRHRARLSIRQFAGRGRAGLFEARSHQLIPIPQCELHHPKINQGIAVLEDVMTDFSAYDEAPHRGLLKGAQFVVGQQSQSIQIALEVNAPPMEVSVLKGRGVLTDLARRLQTTQMFESLLFSHQTARTN
ncbi:MAG: hypothetical protein MK135_06260 [Polyangiaceae bacterium]|nr:hypothetical protein [Polyangiaceae bacterium]